MFSVNLLYENQKTHGARWIVKTYWFMGCGFFFQCALSKEIFLKKDLRVFTLKRVRLGLRALGRAFWVGLHCFSFKMTKFRGIYIDLTDVRFNIITNS